MSTTNPDCDICQFLSRRPLPHQIITTDYWTVGVIPDQAYLGRAVMSLLTHKGSIGELSQDELLGYHSIVKKLEIAYRQAFGATPLNMGCFMNHGFKVEPPHPHVHWQIFPRYKNPVELNGTTFQDDRYGEFYDDMARNPVNDEVLDEIAKRLKDQLPE